MTNLFLDACRCRPTLRPPVWLMRQAGRYLPEYRELRAKHGFLDMCRTPELVKEITLQPILRFGMDAAIIFSDILLPLPHMGLDLSFHEGQGPVIANPVDSAEDIRALSVFDMRKEMGFLAESIAMARQELDDDTALIGFAGAPFTLACYAIQGRGGGNFETVRRWIYRHFDEFEVLLDKFAEMTIAHLEMQIEAGAQAVQIFDTWGGLLAPYDYIHRVFPYVQKILRGVAHTGAPRILFIKGAGPFRFLRYAEAEAIGLDWTMPFDETRGFLGDHFAVQGNLDPMILFAEPEFIKQRVLAAIELNHDKPGYIVNLGHGVNKNTPIEGVQAFVDTVKNYRCRTRG